MHGSPHLLSLPPAESAGGQRYRRKESAARPDRAAGRGIRGYGCGGKHRIAGLLRRNTYGTLRGRNTFSLGGEGPDLFMLNYASAYRQFPIINENERITDK